MAPAAAKKAAETPSKPKAEATDQEKRGAARSAAVTRLIEEQNERFRQLVQEEAAARGVTYKFRPTEQEKAKAKIEALLAEHPELRSSITPVEQPLLPANGGDDA